MVNHWWNNETPEITACAEYVGEIVPFISGPYAVASCPDCFDRCVHCYGQTQSCLGTHAPKVTPPNFTAATFITHDSGERAEYASGMVRDTDADKPRYDLIPLSMLKRLAELYTRGAVKYGDDNWTLADSEEELKRFQASGFRHFVQLLMGERDEDHMAAVVFNVFAAETVRMKLDAE